MSGAARRTAAEACTTSARWAFSPHWSCRRKPETASDPVEDLRGHASRERVSACVFQPLTRSKPSSSNQQRISADRPAGRRQSSPRRRPRRGTRGQRTALRNSCSRIRPVVLRVCSRVSAEYEPSVGRRRRRPPRGWSAAGRRLYLRREERTIAPRERPRSRQLSYPPRVQHARSWIRASDPCGGPAPRARACLTAP
jgi:hypothetical protein